MYPGLTFLGIMAMAHAQKQRHRPGPMNVVRNLHQLTNFLFTVCITATHPNLAPAVLQPRSSIGLA